MFRDTVETLLAGKAVCEYAFEELFHYLSHKPQHDKVNAHLNQIGRKVMQTRDGSAFYCAFTHLNSKQEQSSVQKQFEEMIRSFEPLVGWLGLSLSVTRGYPIKPGDEVKLSTYHAAIEDGGPVREELARLSGMGMFSNNQSTPKGQVDAVFKKLADAGFLVLRGNSGAKYVATGRWAFVYELLDIIAAKEQLDEDEASDAQQGILI